MTKLSTRTSRTAHTPSDGSGPRPQDQYALVDQSLDGAACLFDIHSDAGFPENVRDARDAAPAVRKEDHDVPKLVDLPRADAAVGLVRAIHIMESAARKCGEGRIGRAKQAFERGEVAARLVQDQTMGRPRHGSERHLWGGCRSSAKLSPGRACGRAVYSQQRALMKQHVTHQRMPGLLRVQPTLD